MASEPTWRADQELPHPALEAILLCERTIQEAGTDAAGEYAIRMEVVRLEEGQTVARGDSVMAIPDRRTTHVVILELAHISLEIPGLYDFRVFADGRFVGDEILLVERAE
jgi:hypothetical protein